MKKSWYLASLVLLAITVMPKANASTEIASQVIQVQSPEVKIYALGSHSAEGFMTIENKGTQNHTLIAAYSPDDVETVLHKTINQNGVSTMKRVSQIMIPADESTYLKFGGIHVMLIDTNQAFQPNTTVPIGLIFDDGSEIQVQAKVVS